jgi:hypothetical protein
LVVGRCDGWAIAAADNQKCMWNQKLQLQFLSSWWWAVCRPKHVEQLRNIGVIHSSTRVHLVGSFYERYEYLWVAMLASNSRITDTSLEVHMSNIRDKTKTIYNTAHRIMEPLVISCMNS